MVLRDAACSAAAGRSRNLLASRKVEVLALRNVRRDANDEVKKLEKDVKNAEKRTAKQADKDNAEVASRILAAIEEARREIPAEIELKKNSNPPDALELLINYSKTFPKDSVELKKQIPELRKTAAEWKKAEKAKESEAKKRK